jgi:Clp amino terminal domain, pathogenicity island component
MFERFTEKARRVIFFSVDEAKAYRSSYIESEHLLLGLLRESRNILDAHVDRPVNMDELRKVLAGGPITGQPSTDMNVPLSNEGKRILANGAEEANGLHHKHIGTEHLLLGILREDKCRGARVLRKLGLKLDRVRGEIAESAPKLNVPGGGLGVGAGSGAGSGSGLGSGSVGFEPGVRAIGLVQVSATEFMLTQYNRTLMPRIGEAISVQDEGLEPITYRIRDIVWHYERREGVAQIKTLKLKVEREELPQ